jgi:hypothetical protein
MNYTIDYYFDVQSIDNENVVDILKNIIDSNNITNEPLDYQLEILDNESQQIIFKGGEATTTIPYRYFEEVADYLTHRKREVEEERTSFLDSLFKPTKPKEEEVVVENPPTDNIPEPTNDEIISSIDEEYVSPNMDSIFQEPSPSIDAQVQPEVPIMDTQVQPEVPIMDTQVPIMDTQVQPEVPIMDTQVPIMDTQVPIMDTQVQPEVPIMDTQVQPEVPIMDTQVQPEVPMIDTQVPIMDTQIQQQQQVPIMDTQVQQQQVPIMDTQVQQQQVPIMDTQVQQQPVPIMDTQVQQQQVPIMDTQVQQQQAPMMNNQMYQGGNVKSSIITVRITIQKMKSLPFLFLKKMRYNPTNNFI